MNLCLCAYPLHFLLRTIVTTIANAFFQLVVVGAHRIAALRAMLRRYAWHFGIAVRAVDRPLFVGGRVTGGVIAMGVCFGYTRHRLTRTLP